MTRPRSLLALVCCGVAAWATAAAGVAQVVPRADVGEPSISCAPAQFVEVAGDVGVVFVHDRGATENRHNPETMGSGVAWLDYDGDGWWDLYVVQSGPFPPNGSPKSANRLYRNLGGQAFADFTEETRAGDPGYGQGAVAADYDGDGDSDLYLTNYGPDSLLVNLGNGRFEDATESAGLGVDGWSSSAALADADRDGDLDLYVVRYLQHDPATEPFCAHPETGERDYCDPGVFRGIDDRFYRNLGDGRFEEATVKAGFETAVGKGLGVLFVDLNDDLWPEVYVANDMTINLLFVNQQDGTFQDHSLLSGSGVSREGALEGGMGVALGDVDEDGDADITVANYDVQTNTLYLNQGGLQFEDISALSGFGVPSFNQVGFGNAFSDFNRDGHLDAFISNGHTTERPFRENITYAQLDLLLLGDGTGRFVRGCLVEDQRGDVGRGLAVADFDNDGDPDIAVQRSGGPLALLQNRAADGSWLGLQLRGRSGNTEAIGAVVKLRTSRRQQSRWVIAGSSYQSSSDLRVLFGAPRDEELLELEVQWPSGRRQRIVNPPADRYLTLTDPGEL